MGRKSKRKERDNKGIMKEMRKERDKKGSWGTEGKQGRKERRN